MPTNKDPFSDNTELHGRDLNGNPTSESPTTIAARGDLLSPILDLDPDAWAERAVYSANTPTSVQNSGTWENFIKQRTGFGRGVTRDNPYSVDAGNQARGGQLSALDQLMNGTSVVGAQAGQARNQLGRQVSAATAGGSGLSQALASQAGAMGGSELAGKAGDARLAEFMQQQMQAGSGYGAARGQDQSQMSAFNKAGGEARGQDDALTSFYNNLGSDLQGKNQQLGLDNKKLTKRTAMNKDKANWNTVKAGAEALASVVKLFV